MFKLKPQPRCSLTADHGAEGFAEEPFLDCFVRNRDVSNEPVLDHLANAGGFGARQGLWIGEGCHVSLRPAQFRQLGHEGVVIGLLRFFVDDGGFAAIPNGIENGGHLRLHG